ncbi:MAG: outer membrane beta-barrel protein [Parasphingorhabdus sp.]
MKITSILGVALCLVSTPAMAQKKEQNFEGFKVGIQAGWEGRKINEIILASPNNFRLTDDIDNFSFGGFVGYDAQFDDFVVGVEAELQPDGRKLIAEIPGTGSVDVKSKWSANLSARAGVAATSKLLIYGRLGYRLNRYKARLTAPGSTVPIISASSNANGIIYGGGIEYAVRKNVSLRAEYRETDFSILLKSRQLMAGASLRF